MSLDIWTVAALVIGALGVAGMVAARWRAGLGEWVRALVITAVAVALTGHAVRTGDTLSVWFSGFFVCAALHRWIDAVQTHRAQGV